MPLGSTRDKIRKGDIYTGKSIVSFKFDNTMYRVKSWKDMLLKICAIMSAKHKDEFELVLNLSREDREYFSKSGYMFLECERVGGTNIYVDTDLSASDVVALCLEILQLFGHKENCLSIEAK
jgi:hypothetical protein